MLIRRQVTRRQAGGESSPGGEPWVRWTRLASLDSPTHPLCVRCVSPRAICSHFLRAGAEERARRACAAVCVCSCAPCAAFTGRPAHRRRGPEEQVRERLRAAPECGHRVGDRASMSRTPCRRRRQKETGNVLITSGCEEMMLSCATVINLTQERFAAWTQHVTEAIQ